MRPAQHPHDVRELWRFLECDRKSWDKTTPCPVCLSDGCVEMRTTIGCSVTVGFFQCKECRGTGWAKRGAAAVAVQPISAAAVEAETPPWKLANQKKGYTNAPRKVKFEQKVVRAVAAAVHSGRMTQSEAAQHFKVSQSQVSKIVRGISRVTG